MRGPPSFRALFDSSTHAIRGNRRDKGAEKQNVTLGMVQKLTANNQLTIELNAKKSAASSLPAWSPTAVLPGLDPA